MTYNDVINDKDNRRLEISLKNGGRIVAYCPMEGVHIFACDIMCGIQEEVKRLIMNNLSRGHFILSAVCLSGTYKHKKDNCIKVLNPRDGVAERRLDDYPFLDVSSDYLGLVTVLYLDKMPKGDSIYSLLKDKVGKLGLNKEKKDSLFYFRQSNLTRRAVETLLGMCFSNESQDMILIKAIEVGLHYIDDISTSNSGSRRLVTKSQLKIAEEIMNCLTKRYDEPWTTKCFAEKFKISGTTLNKYFFSVYGYEIKEYQIKVRMERAKEMLRETDYSIGKIAQRVGYATHTKFGTIFKDRYGVTPREFRRRYCIMHLDKQDNNFNG